MRYARRRNQPAIGDVSRKARRFRPQDRFAHGRVDAVSTYHDVGVSRRAVMELHFHTVPLLSQSDASMVKMKHAVRHRRGKHVEQFGTMEVIVGGAEVTLASVGQGLASDHAPIVPAADDNLAGSHAEAAQRLFKPESM